MSKQRLEDLSLFVFHIFMSSVRFPHTLPYEQCPLFPYFNPYEQCPVFSYFKPNEQCPVFYTLIPMSSVRFFIL